jgi:tRNA threonylcarbamoyladenosine biosynthesis protein TsaB
MKDNKFILAIETAVQVCSVCLLDNNGVVSIREDEGVNNHSEKLTSFIHEVMHETNLTYEMLSAVAVSGGPGSYTGLRIGVSTAKGLCYASGVPLIAVDSLHAMAWMMRKTTNMHSTAKVIYQPMIDARRMEVYTAAFNPNLQMIEPVSAEIIDNEFYLGKEKQHIFFVGGNGAQKTAHFAQNMKHVVFVKDNVHSSEGVAMLAMKHLENKQFADIAYYEPFYLKNFIPGKSKVKGLE